MTKAYLKIWIKAAGVRALKTFAQSVLAVISVTGIAFDEVDWAMTLSVALVSALASVLTSIVGLPEVNLEEETEELKNEMERGNRT